MKVRPLSALLQEKAIEELNEIPNEIEDNIEALRNWLIKQQHLHYKDDDQLLLNFLRGSKFRLQRAKEKIDAYYTFRTMAPEIARNMDPHLPEVQKYLEAGIALSLPIPKDDEAGPLIMLIRHISYDPDEITLTTMLKCGSMFCDILLNEDDNFVVSGVKIIWDMKGIQFKTAIQTTPIMIKKIVYCYENAFPTRLKAVYVVNIPIFFEKILNLAKRLVSKKLAERLYFYSSDNWEAIYKDIPKSSLPNEYGGEGGSLNVMLEKWRNTVEKHQKRLLEEDQYYSDESKRTNGSISISDIFGMEGSFKQLQID